MLAVDAVSRGNASGQGRLRGMVFMNAEVVAFLDSLKTSARPAAALPLLRAAWRGLRGDWGPLTTSPRTMRVPKAHGSLPGCIASRPMPPIRLLVSAGSAERG